MPTERNVAPIILRVEATIRRKQPSPLNPDRISLSVDGKAYPHVSSGSRFGYGATFSTFEEAEKGLHEYIASLVEWYETSYARPVKVKLRLAKVLEGVC